MKRAYLDVVSNAVVTLYVSEEHREEIYPILNPGTGATVANKDRIDGIQCDSVSGVAVFRYMRQTLPNRSELVAGLKEAGFKVLVRQIRL